MIKPAMTSDKVMGWSNSFIQKNSQHIEFRNKFNLLIEPFNKALNNFIHLHLYSKPKTSMVAFQFQRKKPLSFSYSQTILFLTLVT